MRAVGGLMPRLRYALKDSLFDFKNSGAKSAPFSQANVCPSNLNLLK